MQAGDITEEASKRMSNSGDRFAGYARCEAHYFDRIDAAHAVRATDAAGRTQLRADNIRHDLRTRGGPNMVRPMVDDFVSLKGQVPVMTVSPEGDNPEDKDKSTNRSRILRAQWTQSRMALQMREMAYHLSCMGDSLFVLDPLFPKDAKDPLKPPGVYITVSRPDIALPQFRVGVDRSELENVIITWDTDGKTAKTRWPQISANDDDKVSVYLWYDQDHKLTVVQDQIVETVTHNLGFCPAQWVFNKAVGEYGQSDIAGILDQHDEYKVMTVVANDSLILATYPVTWIRNPLAFADRLPVGAGAVVGVGADGAIGQLGPAALPQAAHALMDATLRQMEQGAGSAPVRVESGIDHSNISSRAIHAVQGPMESRIASFQDILGSSITSLNAKILLMLSDLPEFNRQPMQAYAQDAKGGGAFTYTGEDVGGWWRTELDWDTGGLGKHERIVMALQLQGAGIVPKSYVAEQAGITDPEQAVKEAAAEQMPPPEAGGPPPGAMPPGAVPSGPPGPPGPGPVQSPAPDAQALGLLGGGQPPLGGPGGGPSLLGPPPAPGFTPLDTPPTKGGLGSPAPFEPFDTMVNDLLPQIPPPILAMIAFDPAGPEGLAIQPLKGGVRIRVSDWRASSVLKKVFAQMGRVQVIVETGKPSPRELNVPIEQAQ